jgi:magnesium-dependent phosphatase 1
MECPEQEAGWLWGCDNDSGSRQLLPLQSRTDDTADQEVNDDDVVVVPKLIVFDLDGCLWSPEMYELLYLMGGHTNNNNNQHAPFTKDPKDPSKMKSKQGQSVRLLGNVRHVLGDLYSNPMFANTRVGISSRTDQPDWALELLDKFTFEATTIMAEPMDDHRLVPNSQPTTAATLLFPLRTVFDSSLMTLQQNSKVVHFENFARDTGIAFEEMMFLDNESGNCHQIAALGVTVVYCPNGVTHEAWQSGLSNFPKTDRTFLRINN